MGESVKRFYVFLAATMALPAAALADSDNLHNGRELYLNIRRIGLEMSKTEVKNARQYQDSPIQALTADNQDFIKGIFDTVLEYNHNRFKWDNSLFMEYGKTTLKPYDEPKTTNENADKILLSSDMSWALWEWGGLKFGPTMRGAYETEFVANDDAPRQNVVRANGGLSLFDHPIVKSLYLTGLYEYDFTYSHDKTSKTGAEAGWRLEYQIRDGVAVSTNGYYREYFSYSDYVATDLERDLSAVARMDTNLWGNFTFGPYVQYRLAKARGAENYGSNFMIGLSFSYINRFGLIKLASTDVAAE